MPPHYVQGLGANRPRAAKDGQTRRLSRTGQRMLAGCGLFHSSKLSSPGRGSAVSDAAEAALPFAIGGDGSLQVLRPKVWPVGGRRPVLGVGSLPEQEVAQAHLAG